MKKLLIAFAFVVTSLFAGGAAIADSHINDQNKGICHVPPGNPDNAHFIPANHQSWAGHEGHDGDFQTDSEEECEGGNDEDEDEDEDEDKDKKKKKDKDNEGALASTGV